ncbi:hypothetical protein SAMN05421830_1054 [Desulfomicrobium norvegicum]|uniref:Uncharacterized protein n=1 Tax=Desulfomicrobium norvegicum (strain DSM 1741 / NCIMB 8310) TaxID=52561 RepID=A0A8G2C2L2_DESNO|nr:hypothetical protein [Desulfomicrobium norvegicum]SFL69360.1 hypothetical protein SAMN05421830_1054 [Desulfomicrobium norvegicum]
MKKNIFIDSTCLFSQKSLLDSFSKPKEDVLNLYDMSFYYAWPKQIMTDFSIYMSAINPSLAPDNFEDHIFHKSKVCQILAREQDLIWESVEKLKKAGLVNIIKFDDPLGRYDEDEPFVTDESLFDLWSSLKMNVLRAPHDTQQVLNIAPLDIDVVAHAIATNNIYKSQNPKIADGTMAGIMGVQHVLIGEYDYKSISHINPNEIEEFIYNKESFFQKTKDAIHEGHKKIFATFVGTALDFVPFISNVKSIYEKYGEIKEAVCKMEEYKKISILEARKVKLPKPSLQNLVDNFSIFRMNYKLPKKDL